MDVLGWGVPCPQHLDPLGWGSPRYPGPCGWGVEDTWVPWGALGVLGHPGPPPHPEAWVPTGHAGGPGGAGPDVAALGGGSWIRPQPATVLAGGRSGGPWGDTGDAGTWPEVAGAGAAGGDVWGMWGQGAGGGQGGTWGHGTRVGTWGTKGDMGNVVSSTVPTCPPRSPWAAPSR